MYFDQYEYLRSAYTSTKTNNNSKGQKSQDREEMLQLSLKVAVTPTNSLKTKREEYQLLSTLNKCKLTLSIAISIC